MVQQDIGGSGRRRRRERADDGVGGERGAQRLGLEPAFEDRPRRARQQLDCRRQVRPQAAHPAIQRPQSRRVAEARSHAAAAPPAGAGQQVRSRVCNDRFQNARDPIEQGVVARKRFGVAPAEAGDRLLVGRGVRAEQQVASVRERRERRRIARQDRQTVLLQPQVAHDLRQQQADDVGAGGDLVARPERLGRGAAAQYMPALQDADRPAGPRQIGSGYQSVVSAADDDAVV